MMSFNVGFNRTHLPKGINYPTVLLSKDRGNEQIGKGGRENERSVTKLNFERIDFSSAFVLVFPTTGLV